MHFQEEFWGKKSGMGIIWLCATLGPRHKRGPSKKDLQRCDVADVCTKIVHSPTPLPLRTSAGLLVGVVRVHDAHYELFVHDVINLENSVRKAMISMRGATGGIVPGQDMVNGGQARPDQITLGNKPADEPARARDWAVNQAMDWELFMDEYEGREAEGYVDDGSELESARDGTPSDRAARHIANEKEITMPGYRYRQASIDPDVFDRLSVGPEFEHFEEGGIDLGLDIGMEIDTEGDKNGLPGDTRRKRARENSEQGVASAVGFGVPSSSGFGAGGLDDLIADGLDMGFGDLTNDLPVDERERRETSALMDAAGNNVVTTENGATSAEGDELVGPNETDTQKKPKKKRAGLIDELIEVSPDESRAMRDDYAVLMDQAREAARSKEADQQCRVEANDYLQEGPLKDLALGGDIQDFWSAMMTSSRPERPVVQETRGYKRKLGEEADDLYADDGAFGAQAGEGFDEGMDLGGPELDGEPGRGRAGTQDMDIEVARRASQYSEKRAAFPWDVEDRAASDFGEAFAGQASSITGTGAGGRFSIDTPLEDRLKRRARSTSIVSFGRPGSVAPLASARGGSEMDLELPELDAVRSQAASTQKSSLVPSTGKFLDYIKKIPPKGGRDVFDVEELIDFSDIAPPETVARRVAAGAFYNILTLATKSLVKVQQEESYGEIQVTIARA